MTIHFKLTGAFLLWKFLLGIYHWNWIWMAVTLDVLIAIYLRESKRRKKQFKKRRRTSDETN